MRKKTYINISIQNSTCKLMYIIYFEFLFNPTSMISAFSSAANRLGTSPVFSKLSMSSRNDSSLI